MKILAMLCLLFFGNGISQNFKTNSTIKTKYKSISSFNVLYDKKGNYHIAVFSYSKNRNKSFLEIFNRHKKVIFSKDLGSGYLHHTKVITLNNKLIFFQNKLFLLNIVNMQLDSITLKNDNYSTIQISNNLLIANKKENIYLYNLHDFNLAITIQREESLRWDLPKVHQDIVVYKNKRNELLVYNYKNKKIQKRFNTGEKEVNLLGIKIGSMEDAISDYKISKNFLYFVTMGGSLYKYDFGLKKNLISRKYFMGDENNAGLINNFWFTDANLDGIEDFVGAAVDNNIYCINGKDLSTLWQYNTGNENQHPIYLYDINADSIPEVFGVNYYDQKLFIIDGKTGKLLYDKILNNEGKWTPTSVFVDDLDNDGNIDIVCESGLPNELLILELKK